MGFYFKNANEPMVVVEYYHRGSLKEVLKNFTFDDEQKQPGRFLINLRDVLFEVSNCI